MVNYQLFFSTFVPKISKTIEMKRLFYPIMILLCAILYVNCDNYETYGDKKAKERDAINKFISENNIKVINEDQFEDQGYTTDTAKNEYVRISRTGVYMQIVRKGCGTQLEQKKSVNVICRFTEYNILADSVMLSNLAPFYIYDYNSGYQCTFWLARTFEFHQYWPSCERERRDCLCETHSTSLTGNGRRLSECLSLSL